ncbi:hypothetical protein C0992_004347 [Termitomyces sp. T32_za158]|nr:hypothetical protein C0992_004347 [Termitomyces sp. T32_za158]
MPHLDMSTPADLISLLISSSSTRAPASLVPPADLAAWAYVPKIDTFFSSLANVGPEADWRTIVGAMKVFEKWLGHQGKAPEVTLSREEELRAWCMAWYAEHVGEVVERRMDESLVVANIEVESGATDAACKGFCYMVRKRWYSQVSDSNTVEWLQTMNNS